jgi:replication-associated recombination protein RarA
MESLFAATAPTADILTEKYRPQHIADFIGLDKPRRIAAKIASNPPSKGGLLFLGEPGIGKTTLALAIAAEMPAELHHIASQDCNVDRLRQVVSDCQYVPRMGCKRHIVLITQTAQLLERVWESEAPQGAARPNFARIVKEACNNVRASLMQLQTELLLAD